MNGLTLQQRDALRVISEWYPMPVPVWNLRTDRDEIQVNARAAASLVRLGLAEHTRTTAGTKAVRQVRKQDNRIPDQRSTT